MPHVPVIRTSTNGPIHDAKSVKAARAAQRIAPPIAATLALGFMFSETAAAIP